MALKLAHPTIAVVAYKYLLAGNKSLTTSELYDRIEQEGLYRFNAHSRQEGIGILALSIKRHMSNSKRNDKFDCILFQSDDGLANSKKSTVKAIKTAKNYITKLANLLSK